MAPGLCGALHGKSADAYVSSYSFMGRDLYTVIFSSLLAVSLPANGQLVSD